MAIARALAQDAKVILADEPVASLDPESSATVLESLRAAAAAGVAVMASLHQVHLAMQYADRIIALRDGALVADAPDGASSTAAPSSRSTSASCCGGTGEPLAPVAADAEWDAGDLGCGELVLELGRDAALAPGRRAPARSRSIPARRPTCRPGAA